MTNMTLSRKRMAVFYTILATFLLSIPASAQVTLSGNAPVVSGQATFEYMSGSGGLAVSCGNNSSCSNTNPDPFDPAMACTNGGGGGDEPSICPFPATMTSVDETRGVYGYQPDQFVLTNTGASAVTINSATGSTGFSAASYCYNGNTVHDFPYSLAAGDKCTLGVAFTPTDIGSVITGTITVNYTSGSSYNLVVATSATAGELTVTNASVPTAIPSFYQSTNGLYWAFPVVLPLSTQTTTLTIMNRGSSTTATGLTLTLNEGNLADLQSLTNFSETTTCGSSLAPGASCTVTITYYPQASGPHRALLTIATSNAGTIIPEIYGEAVPSLLSRTEGNPYCPTTGSPSYPGGVTTDGPAVLPTDCVNTTDTNISGNTITGYTPVQVCPTCTYTTVSAALQYIAAQPTPCGFWIQVAAQTSGGAQATYNDTIANSSWPTNYNPTAVSSPATCSSPNYITTDHLSNLPPAGNRISPAWEGYSMLPGIPPYSQPSGGPGNYVPLIYGSSINTATLNVPRGLGMKVRFVGIHFSGTTTVVKGNATIINASQFTDSSVSFPDCIGNPPSAPNAICTLNRDIVFDRVLISGTPNWFNICLLCVIGGGIDFEGATESGIENSFIADIECQEASTCTNDSHDVGPGGSGFAETSAIKIYNNFLSAPGINMISGGSRSVMVPSNLMAINNLWEKPEYYVAANTYGQYGMPPYIFVTPARPEVARIKGMNEFKTTTKALLENNIYYHGSYTGQADQTGKVILFDGIGGGINDGQLCGSGTSCQGYNMGAFPTWDPNFSGASTSNITFRNWLVMDGNICLVVDRGEYGDSQNGDYQLVNEVGATGNISIHDGLCDNLDGIKYGPSGGGYFDVLSTLDQSVPYVNPSTFGNCGSSQCTWNSWSPYIVSGLNDKSTAPAQPFSVLYQRITAIGNTSNLANPPVAQAYKGDMGGINENIDQSNAAAILDLSATYASGTCSVTGHFLSAALGGLAIGDKILVWNTPDEAPAGVTIPNNWVNAPVINVTALISNGFQGSYNSLDGSNCPTAAANNINQTNYPPPIFLGFFDDKNGYPAVLKSGIEVLDSIFPGDFASTYNNSCGTPYNCALNSTASSAGYCWTGNMMVAEVGISGGGAGVNNLAPVAPTAYPGCAYQTPAITVDHNYVGTPSGLVGTNADPAIGFAHYVDGSWTKLMFGGTNDYTVSSTAATYSTTGGPVGVSPSTLATELSGVLDGIH